MSLVQDYDSIMLEHMDIMDSETRAKVISVEEADKGQLLSSLTSKLYDKIVEKVDDIYFGSIPKSKGDITKIENFESLNECLGIIQNIVKQYGQNTEPVDVVTTAITNLRERERLFSKAFVLNVELPMVLYNTIALSIVSSVSFLIATSIEFIKNPGDDTFTVSLDKVAYSKTANNLLFDDLRKFNIACVKGDVDKTVDHCINSNVKGFTGTAIAGGILATAAVIGLAKVIIPIIQELTYFFYHSRQSVSDYFAIQADLLQMNTANIVYKDMDESKKKEIIKKQSGISEKFRKISNAFDINYKKSEKATKKTIDDERKKYKVSDLQPDTSVSMSLF